MKLSTQLNFGGNCEEAFRFYEEHLGGKVTVIMRQNEAPGAPHGNGDAVIHARLQLGDTELIANDVPPTTFRPMRSAYLYFSVDSADEADRVHGLLSDGGEIYIPMDQTFFAERFSMLRDRFGVLWSIICPRER